MKRVLPIALGLLLCHCGTEVGNGVAPEEKTAQDSAGNGAPTTAPETAQDNYADEIFSTAFLAACASPFAEPIDGTFMNSANSKGFAVKTTEDGRRTVSRLNGFTAYVITPEPAVGPYAIQALPVSPQVSCGEVQTTTLTDGSLQRSVTLSNGTQLSWTLTDGQVSSMKRTTEAAEEEIWNRR